MSKPMRRIDKIVQDNERHAKGLEFVKSLKIAEELSMWHDKQQKLSERHQLAQVPPQGKELSVESLQISEIERKMAYELRKMKEDLIHQRRQDLKQLLSQEFLEYEAELNEKGLAIYQEKD